MAFSAHANNQVWEGRRHSYDNCRTNLITNLERALGSLLLICSDCKKQGMQKTRKTSVGLC